MHEPWINNFFLFWEDVKHGFSPDLEIDRIDSNKNYEPRNIRWVTRKAQMNNTRQNIIIEWKGKKISITQAAELEGIPVNRVFARLNLGWTYHDALTLPKNTKKPKYAST